MAGVRVDHSRNPVPHTISLSPPVFEYLVASGTVKL